MLRQCLPSYLFPHFPTLLFGSKSLSRAHWRYRVRESLFKSIYIIFFCNSSREGCVFITHIFIQPLHILLSSVAQSCPNLCNPMDTHFYTSGYNPILCFLFFYSNYSIFCHWELTHWLLCPSDSFTVFKHFLTFWYKMFQAHLVNSLPQNQFSLRTSGSFNWRMVLETRSGYHTRMSLLLGVFGQQS